MRRQFLRAVVHAMFWTVVTANFALAATTAQLMVVSGLQVQWDMAILSAIISTLSGVAALLRRIDKELTSNDGVLKRPALFICMHLTGSWVAGILAFVASNVGGFDVWKGLGLLVVGSYAGAAALDFATDVVAKRIDPSIPVEKLP